MNHVTLRFLSLAASLLFGTSPLVVRAQGDYPNRPIQITVGLQAGTGSDIAVRNVTEKMGSALGQPFVVASLPGAAGQLAAQAGAKAAPTGYNLVALSSAALTTLPHLTKNPLFNPQKDLVPIGVFVTFPSVLSVNGKVPVQSVREYLEFARKNPGKLTYASGGSGSVQHLAMETLKWMAKIDVLHVPYKGMAQATADLVSGQVDSAIQGVVAVIPFVKSGQVRPLAWTGARRNALFPDLPTLQESGITGYDYQPWTGLFAPAGTPPEIISKLSAELRRASRLRDIQMSWEPQGMETMDVTPEQLAKMIQTETAQTAQVIKTIGLKID